MDSTLLNGTESKFDQFQLHSNWTESKFDQFQLHSNWTELNFNCIQTELNWIQIQLKKNEMQIDKESIENFAHHFHSYCSQLWNFLLGDDDDDNY